MSMLIFVDIYGTEDRESEERKKALCGKYCAFLNI
jgi:hypothetical protein